MKIKRKEAWTHNREVTLSSNIYRVLVGSHTLC